jgi:tetratricopeptide (TPR) repeat protein
MAPRIAALALLTICPAFSQPRPKASKPDKPAPATPKKPQIEPLQQTNQLDGNPSIFAVLAAANAAGYDAQINAVSNSPVRKAVREYLAKKDLKSLGPLQRFMRDHRPKDPSAELGQYISFALFSTGPPEFKPLRSDIPMPPDTAGLEELPALLADFYQEANIGELWKQVEPYYDQEIAKYTQPVSRAVLEVNAYFRNSSNGYLGHRFQVYIELLGAPNQVQTRNYVDDDFVVVTPAAELPIDEIRHAYIHYIADPLGVKYSEDLKKKHALGDYALGSPLLSELYKTDFNLLATECFIKAVESRLPPRTPAIVDRALREGFVLTPAIAEQLELYEKQDRPLRSYFPDLVAGIDLKKEEKRLDHIDFVSERETRVVRPATVVVAPAEVLTGAAKTLADADHAAYADHEYPRAKALYLHLLEETDQKSMHARAYYGLARIAVLERDPETGDRLFRKALELEPDATTKSWSLFYLGRLADSQSDRDHAVEFYKQALAVPDLPDQVREAAEQGLREPPAKK